MKTAILLLALSAVCACAQNAPATFHHCSIVGSTANTPHLFDRSKIYHCDEGDVEIAGKFTMAIEYGYVFKQEMGEPSGEVPRRATADDYKDYKWCPDPQPWDANQKQMCGDKATTCFDGKPATWDAIWMGHSCATPDHRQKAATK